MVGVVPPPLGAAELGAAGVVVGFVEGAVAPSPLGVVVTVTGPAGTEPSGPVGMTIGPIVRGASLGALGALGALVVVGVVVSGGVVVVVVLVGGGALVVVVLVGGGALVVVVLVGGGALVVVGVAVVVLVGDGVVVLGGRGRVVVDVGGTGITRIPVRRGDDVCGELVEGSSRPPDGAVDVAGDGRSRSRLRRAGGGSASLEGDAVVSSVGGDGAADGGGRTPSDGLTGTGGGRSE